MDHTCEHCGASMANNAYRVTSEEAGITLLDMIVCALCFEEAKRLHLHAEEIDIRSKQPSARSRGSHRPRVGI
jgi:hypothetical protein